ncbi:MAG: hypothetical protein HY913_05375 [Desulfomonile tiedjei]|nr:hypothetical protein [Desulfomonile tiedjei]
MRKIRFLFTALTVGLCLSMFAFPAFAWEFGMTGTMNWYYEFYNQRGSNGFFGPYNVDNGAGTTTANLNYWWNGARLSQNLVTGQDAAKSYFFVLLEPEIKINPAVRLKGRYRLGQYGIPQASYYYTWDSPGTDNALSEGQWTMFWATASTPWGTLGVGKRQWKFGTGLQYDGSDGLTTESLVLNAPYGPLDIGIGFYPHRPARPGATIPIDPYDLVVAPYFNHADKSGGLIKDLLAYVVYNNGPVQAGIMAAGSSLHIGPEGPLQPAFPVPTPAAQLGQDSEFFHGTIFTKYNNGRFFFNGEAAWLYWTDRLSGTGAFAPVLDPTVTVGQFAAGVQTVLPNARYTEQWRFMVETGAICGPAKVTLISAWTPGPDRRNAALIDKQSAAFVWHPSFDLFLGNYDVFRPYSWLFTYNYGSGFNAYNLSLDGYLRDAWVLGGRADYAVAANLNLFGTFIWAERTSNGYGWGGIAPNNVSPIPATFIPDGNLRFAINGAAGSPNIPDRALGWEMDFGADWQLLEGLTFGFLAAYWQPGRWFSYACIDRSVPGWDAPAAANNFGTRPGKKIDAIFGGQVTMSFTF